MSTNNMNYIYLYLNNIQYEIDSLIKWPKNRALKTKIKVKISSKKKKWNNFNGTEK